MPSVLPFSQLQILRLRSFIPSLFCNLICSLGFQRHGTAKMKSASISQIVNQPLLTPALKLMQAASWWAPSHSPPHTRSPPTPPLALLFVSSTCSSTSNALRRRLITALLVVRVHVSTMHKFSTDEQAHNFQVVYGAMQNSAAIAAESRGWARISKEKRNDNAMA